MSVEYAPEQAKAATKRRVRDPLGRWMREHKWGWQTPRNGICSRLYSLTIEHRPWWDWGHRMMVLTGTDHGGNWSEPNPPTWWYRRGQAKRMWRTGYPRHPLSTFEIVTDYETFTAKTKGLNEDRMYEWSAIGTNQDGELHLGHQFWGGSFYGLQEDETAVLRRYLRMWRRLDWFGLRSWLYAQGLHAAVDRKVPWTCQATPPPGQGGYTHWHCGLPKRHAGMHRFNNYVWGDVGGEPIGAMVPTEVPE